MIDIDQQTNINSNAYDRNAMNSVKTITKKTNMETEYANFVDKIVKQLIVDPRNHWIPHVNGWYYANMVGGNWEDDVMVISSDSQSDYKEFSPGATKLIPRVKENFGHLIKDVNPPQIGLDYDGVSGRLRTISVATRMSMTQEFSIVWKENSTADVFKYHEYWIDYIDANKKGFIPSKAKYDDGYFIDVPYFNAVWVAILKPFSFELLGLIKIMGVAPTGLPIEGILGQRGSSQATTYTITYKAVDCIIQMFDGKPSGNFYREFMQEQYGFFDAQLLNSLQNGNNLNVQNVKLFS